MSAGFVYVLSNVGMPGLVKIGYTTKNPMDRARELYTSGVPFEFDVEFVIFSNYAQEAEQEIHQELQKFRYNANREFFRMEVFEAVRIVANMALREWDLEAADADYVVDASLGSAVQQHTGCCPPDVRQVIENVSASSFKAAYAKLNEDREKRKSSSKSVYDIVATESEAG